MLDSQGPLKETFKTHRCEIILWRLSPNDGRDIGIESPDRCRELHGVNGMTAGWNHMLK